MSYDFVFLFSPDTHSDAVIDFRPLHLRVNLCDLVAVLVIDNDRVAPFPQRDSQAPNW
jgi:hypothetical protein